MPGRKNPTSTQAAACTPPESENKSILSPNKKLKKMSSVLLASKGNSRMKIRYAYGFTYPKKLIWFNTMTCNQHQDNKANYICNDLIILHRHWIEVE